MGDGGLAREPEFVRWGAFMRLPRLQEFSTIREPYVIEPAVLRTAATHPDARPVGGPTVAAVSNIDAVTATLPSKAIDVVFLPAHARCDTVLTVTRIALPQCVPFDVSQERATTRGR